MKERKTEEEQNEINRTRDIVRERKEQNRELKQNREIETEKDIFLGKLFELATSDKVYVSDLNLNEKELTFYEIIQVTLK